MPRYAPALLFTGILLLVCSTACRYPETPAPTPDPPTATAAPPSPTPLPPPTATATVIPLSGICSPLAHHPLEQLPSLVSWPFNPDPKVRHYGVDLAHWSLGEEASSLHDPVQAALDGKIAGTAPDRPPYGNMIIIETPYAQLPPALIAALEIPHSQSLYHMYAHLADPPDFRIGQPVSCGQNLNRAGLTGWAVTAHLHFETRWGPPGFTFTAMAYYTADSSAEERTNFEAWFSSGLYHPFDAMILLTLPQP